MQKKSSVYSYLEKYCIFYLSKYSVTKGNFAFKIENKLKNDFWKKKINESQFNEGLRLVSKLVNKFSNLGLIDDEKLIELKVNFFISKGLSLKQMYLKLLACKFEKTQIKIALNTLKQIDELNLILIKNYCIKKKKFNYDIHWDKNDEEYEKKHLDKMINYGFNLNDCLNYLNKIKCNN